MKRILLVLLVATPLLATLAADPGPVFGLTFTVDSTTNLSDSATADDVCDDGSGRCSLRAAIMQANGTLGVDTIGFNIPGADPGCNAGTAVCTITPDTPFPFVTDPVVIDGTTQPGFDAGDPMPVVLLDGVLLGGTVDGLRITAGGSTVRGLTIQRFGTVGGSDAIELSQAGGNTIEGNCLGTEYTCEDIDMDLPGTGDEYGNRGNGVFINGTSNNTIGGTTAAKANVLGGNFENGVKICSTVAGVCANSAATNNLVIGNFIGIDSSLITPATLATLDLENTLDGILIENASNNTIGGTTAAHRNVISGNKNDGIEIKGATSSGNVVLGNYFGANGLGNDDQRNGSNGVHINGSPNNTIGGTDGGAGNLISGNLTGLQITGAGATGNQVQGNFIGTNAAGTGPLDSVLQAGNLGDGVFITAGANNNTIGGTTAGARNLISENNSDGIEISGNTTTSNFIRGNYIGTNVTGDGPLGNGNPFVDVGSGVKINNSPANTIGGTAAGSGNLISGNVAAGIEISGNSGSGTVIQGNLIGTDKTGAFGVGNGEDGIFINSAKNTVVGGTAGGAGNVISGNGVAFYTAGVFIQGTAATGNLVQGNLIGTDITGTGTLGNSSQGVFLNGSPTNTIGGTAPTARNIISGNGTEGVLINGVTATGVLVQGNYIGLDINGTAMIPNQGDGIRIATAVNNTIGGTAGGARNVISGNGAVGVDILDPFSTGNLVQGNYIGTDQTGTVDLGNTLEGVYINGGVGNTIGGTTVAARNVISGNNHGVGINDAGGVNNLVQGNFIGTNSFGTAAVPNAFDGVRIAGNAGNNTIGGSAGAENVIAYNGGDGVFLDQTGGVGNRVDFNSIFSNAGLGIDIFPNGPSPNDAGDPDGGPNGLQNFPVLTSATSNGSGTTIVGTLNSTANTSFAVQFYHDTGCDPSGFGEGRISLGTTNVMTNGSGDGSLNQLFAAIVADGWFVTATATDPAGNTSEFSACQAATGVPAPTLIQGDVDCSGGPTPVNSVDALKILRHNASLPVAQTEPCPDIGTLVTQIMGDVDCSGLVNSIDALKILRYSASLSVLQNEPPPCTDIGVVIP